MSATVSKPVSPRPVSPSSIPDYHLRVGGFTLAPKGVRAALMLMHLRFPRGFTRADLAKVLADGGIPISRRPGTYVSPKDGKTYPYPANPANLLAGRILERMRAHGVLTHSARVWTFSSADPAPQTPPKYL